MTGPEGARSAWTSIKWKVVGSYAFIATRTVHVLDLVRYVSFHTLSTCTRDSLGPQDWRLRYENPVAEVLQCCTAVPVRKQEKQIYRS